MDFTTFESSALEERLAVIKLEIDAPGANLDALEEEVRAIKAEMEKRKVAEAKREEVRKAVANGEGTVIAEGEAKTNMEERKMNEVKKFEINSEEYRTCWLKQLQGKPLTEEERAGYTQGSTYATNAIPTIVADKFFSKMKKVAPMLDEITLFNVAGNLKFVAEGTRNAASVHSENQAGTAATDTTVSVTLGAKEFMKLVGISKSARLMSVDAFEDWIVDYLGEDIARAIEDYIINDSTNGIEATFTDSTREVTAASTGITYANIAALVALLPAAYDAEAKILVNKKTLYGEIAGITNSAGNPIFIPDIREGIEGRLMGYPVVLDDYVAASGSHILLGKWKDVVGNLSEGIAVEADASAGFVSGSILYRGYASFDSKPAKVDAIVRLVKSST